MGRVNVYDPATGKSSSIPDDDATLGAALAKGLKLETAPQEAERAAAAGIAEAHAGGTLGAIKAGAEGFLRGASLGLSDVVQVAGGDDLIQEELGTLRREHAGISTATEIAGALAPSLLSGGSGVAAQAARFTPAGVASALGARITARGATGGALKSAGYAAGGGALEGAAQGAGSYLSSVALGDKELSAEGFLANAGMGAALGGGVSGGLSVAERGFVAARSLIPKHKATETAVKRAAEDVDTELQRAMAAGDDSISRAKEQLELMRLQRADLALAADQRLAQKQIAEAEAQARAAAAKADEAVAKAQLGQQKLSTQAALDEIRLAKAKAPRTTRGRKGTAPTDEAAPSPVLAEGSGPAVSPESPAVPTYDSLGPDDVVDAVLPPEALVNRIELPGAGTDKVKAEKARKFVEGGARTDVIDPIRLAVHPDGRYEVIDGRNRIAALVEDGRPIRAKVERAYVPDDSNVVAAGEVAETAAPLAREETESFVAGLGHPVDDDYRRAMERWEGDIGGYEAMQEQARKGTLPAEQSNVEAMDRAIAAGRVPRDVVMFRGLDSSIDTSHLAPGSFLDDPGFTAVTASRDTAGRYAKGRGKGPGTIVEVTVPQGTNGAWVVSGLKDVKPGDYSWARRSLNDELVLGRNTRMRVRGVRDEGGMRVVDAVVEPMAPVAAASPVAGDLESLLGQSVGRGKAGASFADMAAEARVPRATALDPVHEAMAELDPQAARLVEQVRAVEQARAEVAAIREESLAALKPRDYAAALRKRADAKADELRAAGKLSRDKDVVREMAGDRVVREGQGAESYLVQRGRETRSRMRDPYTDEELVAKAQANPTFYDHGDLYRGQPAAIKARMRADGSNELAERVLSGRSLDDLEIEERILEGGRMRTVRRPATAEDVVGALQRQEPDIADLVAKRLGVNMEEVAKAGAGAAVDEVADMDRAVRSLSAYERSVSDLAQSLGPAAPIEATELAARYAAAVDDQARKASTRAAQLLDDAPESAFSSAEARAVGGMQSTPSPTMSAVAPELTPAERIVADAARAADTRRAVDLVSLPGAPAQGTARKGGVLGLVSDLGAANEALQFAGINLPFMPDVDKIPVIGPLVGGYFKLRALMTGLGKAGFRVPFSGEARVAAGAVKTRERVAEAMDNILSMGAKVAAKARPIAASQAWRAPDVLKAVLYDDGERRKPSNDVGKIVQARTEELLAAQQNPAGIRTSVRASMRDVQDPDVIDAVAALQERRLTYLAKHAPVVPTQALLSKSKWQPSPSEVERFARRVRAVNDPVSVLEDVATGRVTPEGAEVLREVYPRLYAEAQERLMEQAPKLRVALPHATVVRLSILFQAPLANSLEPERMQAIQAAGVPPPPQSQPGPPPAAGMQPPPAGAPQIDSLYMTDAQKRARS